MIYQCHVCPVIKISLCGQVLSARDFEERKKTGQDLFTNFIHEYNNTNGNASYSCDAFLTFFNPWTEVIHYHVTQRLLGKRKDKVWEINGRHEKLFNQWNSVGTHGTFQETMDHATSNSSTNTNPRMLYMYTYLHKTNNQKFFDPCMGLLPDAAFSEPKGGLPHFDGPRAAKR